MDPLKTIRKLASEITDQKTLHPDFVYQRVLWTFVVGWEEGLQYCSRRRPVMQLDKYGNIIEIHRSLKDAGAAIGVSGASIRNVCKGKKHSCKGFHWRYIESPEQIKKILEGWQSKL